MQIKNLKYLDNIQKLLVFLLILAGMNFAQKCFYFIYAAFIVILIYRRNCLKLDMPLAILLLFSTCYIIFSPEAHSSPMQALKQFAYPMCYLIGLNFLADVRSFTYTLNREKKLIVTIVAVGMGSFVHYIMNMIGNIGNTNRNTVDIWSNDVMGATLQAMMAIIALSVFCAMLFTSESIKIRLLSISGLLVIFIYNLVLAGRTIVLLIVILLVVSYLYTHRSDNTIMKKKNARMILWIFLACFVLYVGNLFGIRDYIGESNLVNRLEEFVGLRYIGDDIRVGIQFKYLQMAPRYLWGGGKIRSILGYYAHDLYLAAYNDAGILSVLFLVFFVAHSVYKLIVFLKHPTKSIKIKTLYLCIFIGLNVVFYVEPILNAMPWIFCVFCFYQGLLNKEVLR